MTTIGARIKHFRERKGLNQSELARLCGITPATISRLESGGLKDVQTAIAKRLALALGVSIDHLAGTWEENESELLAAVGA